MRRFPSSLSAVVVARMFGSGSNTPKYDMNLVNEEYETKMIGYEASCADGSGDSGACHYVGEYGRSL